MKIFGNKEVKNPPTPSPHSQVHLAALVHLAATILDSSHTHTRNLCLCSNIGIGVSVMTIVKARLPRGSL